MPRLAGIDPITLPAPSRVAGALWDFREAAIGHLIPTLVEAVVVPGQHRHVVEVGQVALVDVSNPAAGEDLVAGQLQLLRRPGDEQHGPAGVGDLHRERRGRIAAHGRALLRRRRAR